MNKIYLIIGKSAVGKDTLKSFLLDNGEFHNAISFTTRPMRSNERNGVDYHFVSDAKMDEIINSGQALETTEYKQSDGTLFRYCFARNCLSDNKNNLMVINPIGLKQLCSYPDIKEKISVIYLKASEMTRKARYYARESNDIESLRELWKTRAQRDYEDFKNLKSFLKTNQISYIEVEGNKKKFQQILKEINKN